MIEIICTNNGERRNYPQGTTLQQVAADMGLTGEPVYAAYVNNKLQELDFSLFNPYIVEFIGFKHPEGFTITNTMNAKVVRVKMSNNSIVIWFRNV